MENICFEIMTGTIFRNNVHLVAYLSSYHEKTIKALYGACLGGAGRLSTSPRIR